MRNGWRKKGCEEPQIPHSSGRETIDRFGASMPQAPAVEWTCRYSFSPTSSRRILRRFACDYSHGIPGEPYDIIDGHRGEASNRFSLNEEPLRSTERFAWRC